MASRLVLINYTNFEPDEAVTRVVNAKIFNGNGNGLLAPKDTLTKAEALTAVRNLLLQSELINN